MIKNLMEYKTPYSKSNKLRLVCDVIESYLAHLFLCTGVMGNPANLIPSLFFLESY